MARTAAQEHARHQLALQINNERRARTQLRKIDEKLKTEGTYAALVALFEVRMTKLPLISITRQWYEDYRDLLLAWQAGYMPEVFQVFERYGPRRARDKAYRGIYCEHRNERLSALYVICERTLRDMAERRRRSVADIDGEFEPEVLVQSINEVSRSELEGGRKL